MKCGYCYGQDGRVITSSRKARLVDVSLLLALLAVAGPSLAAAVPARADGGDLDLEIAICTTTAGISTPSGPNSHVSIYYGPADQNGSGVLTLLNCTGTPLVKAVDRSRRARDRAPDIFDSTKTEKISGMRGRYHYLNFNPPDLEHAVGLDHWYYLPTQAGARWDGACIHPVEFTMRSGPDDTVFVSDVDICKTDILILGWSR
jgi:hypothetical protein